MASYSPTLGGIYEEVYGSPRSPQLKPIQVKLEVSRSSSPEVTSAVHCPAQAVLLHYLGDHKDPELAYQAAVTSNDSTDDDDDTFGDDDVKPMKPDILENHTSDEKTKERQMATVSSSIMSPEMEMQFRLDQAATEPYGGQAMHQAMTFGGHSSLEARRRQGGSKIAPAHLHHTMFRPDDYRRPNSTATTTVSLPSIRGLTSLLETRPADDKMDMDESPSSFFQPNRAGEEADSAALKSIAQVALVTRTEERVPYVALSPQSGGFGYQGGQLPSMDATLSPAQLPTPNSIISTPRDSSSFSLGREDNNKSLSSATTAYTTPSSVHSPSAYSPPSRLAGLPQAMPSALHPVVGIVPPFCELDKSLPYDSQSHSPDVRSHPSPLSQQGSPNDKSLPPISTVLPHRSPPLRSPCDLQRRRSNADSISSTRERLPSMSRLPMDKSRPSIPPDTPMLPPPPTTPMGHPQQPLASALSTASSTATSPTLANSASVRASVSLSPNSDGMPQHDGPAHNSSAAVYKCTVPGCSAPPFQTQYLLNSHMNVHSSDRPHYCPIAGCPRSYPGKGFKRKNEMIRHGLVHESPGYVCPFCPDREHKYPRPDNLQRHVRAHHQEENKEDRRLRDVLAQRPDGPNHRRRRRHVA